MKFHNNLIKVEGNENEFSSILATSTPNTSKPSIKVSASTTEPSRSPVV